MGIEPVQALLRVTRVLESLGVRYVVGGSFASSLYGAPRTTLDADLLADLQSAQVELFARQLEGEFYLDRSAIREALQERRSFNLIHLETMFKVDIFLPRRRAFDESQLARRIPQRLSAESTVLAFATPEDTVLAKLEWYRQGGEVSERQWRDVLEVLRVQGRALDRAYLERWAATLGVADLLERAIREAGEGEEVSKK